MIDNVIQHSSDFGLSLNIEKTKSTIFTKKNEEDENEI